MKHCGCCGHWDMTRETGKHCPACHKPYGGAHEQRPPEAHEDNDGNYRTPQRKSHNE